MSLKVFITFVVTVVLFWQTAAHAFLVDLRSYSALETPNFKTCTSRDGGGICTDGNIVVYGSSKEFVRSYSHGIRVYFNRDNGPPYLFGVYKHHPSPSVPWECYENPGMKCFDQNMADYAPQAMPLVMDLPVLAGSSISNNRVTPGATLIPEYAVWRSLSVRQFDAGNCGQAPVSLGLIYQKIYAFVADTVQFGGTIGAQSNIFVVEGDMSGCDPGNLSGRRLERYYYSSTYGLLRETAMEDTTCNPECSAGCDGFYDSVPSDTFFSYTASGDLLEGAICPQTGGAW